MFSGQLVFEAVAENEPPQPRMSEATISAVDPHELLSLFGPRDQFLRKIRSSLGVDIRARHDRIVIEGDEAAVIRATEVIEQMRQRLTRQGKLLAEDVAQVLARVMGNGAAEHPQIATSSLGRQVSPRTEGQARYVQAIQDHDLVFCTGPAGTGKTYLAVAMAVAALKQQRVRKLVLVRPAVEAGESLGFLPGDLQAKINPYLRPLLDALREIMDFDVVKRLTEQDVIEMIPLAYMRGRTLNHAFIILDEAQNTTVSQMKMFLTRMGLESKVVVSGDTTQVDLPENTRSGLVDAMSRLHTIEGYCEVELMKSDIVRHRLVQEIVQAYEEEPKRRK